MKKFVLTLSLILFGYTLSNASILTKNNVELTVGSNPASIVEDPNSGIINIFCAGVDVNNNNTIDAGDEAPSWWTYDPVVAKKGATKVKDFEAYFVEPLKPSVTTEDGKTLFGIPFKCSVDGGQFSGQSKFEIYTADDFQSYASGNLDNSEYLYISQNHSQSIKIFRKNGTDLLFVLNSGSTTPLEYDLGGDATDFTFADLNGDGTNEVAVLLGNDRIAFLNIQSQISLIKMYDLTALDKYSGNFGHLYSYGGYIYTSIPDSNTLVKIHSDIAGNVSSTVFQSSSNNASPNPSYYPLNDSIAIATSSGFDVRVINDIYDKEMHRTSTATDIVYSAGNKLYVGGTKKVYIYDITNEPYKDPNLVAQAFTGYQPLDIFSYNDTLYSVNLGVDFNYNSVKDLAVGDQKASISKVIPFEITGKTFLFGGHQIDFDFPINFPLNTNVSTDGDIILPSGNMAYYYNITDNEIFDSLDAEAYVTCSFRVLDYLVLGMRDATDGKSYVRIKKGDFIDVKTEVGKNVVDLTVYQNASGFGVLSVSEGTFGEADAKLNILKLSTMGFGDNISIDIGKTASAVVTNNDQTKAAVVMNGSHEIHIIDLLTDEKVLTFSTGTTGYGGPRDAKFVGDTLFVTTYSNQILAFDSKTGTKLGSLALDGKSEGLYVDGAKIYATNINYSNYQPNNRIFAYKYDKLTDVETQLPTLETIRVYPNPVINDFHIVSDDLAGANNLVIVNSNGKIVATHSGYSDGAIALNTQSLGLDAGTYTAVINGQRAVRFIVIK